MLPQRTDADVFQHLFKSVDNPPRRPSVSLPTRPVTPVDMGSFKANPLAIVGKTFVLHSTEDGDRGVLFEVIELRASKEEMWYQVRFEGYSGFVQIGQKEVMKMVEDSILFIS
jgi:hypothetical protein